MSDELQKNAVSFAVSVWYEPETRHIYLSRPTEDGFVTTISGDPNSARGHVHLFRRLAEALERRGVPAPPTGLRVEDGE